MGKKKPTTFRGLLSAGAFLAVLLGLLVFAFTRAFVSERARLASAVGFGSVYESVQGLASSDFRRKEYSLAWLRARGSEATPELQALLGHLDPAVRHNAIDALTFVNGPRDVMIKSALHDTDPEVRSYAAYVVAHHPRYEQMARVQGVRLLADPATKPGLRLRAAEMLVTLDDKLYRRHWRKPPSAIAAQKQDAALLAVAMDAAQDATIRRAAASHLFGVEPSVGETLASACGSEDPVSREIAALGLMASEVPALDDIRALAPLVGDPDGAVRAQAVMTLMALGARAERFFIPTLRHPWPGTSWQPRAASPSVRAAVVEALEAALAATPAGDATQQERERAADALGQLRDPNAPASDELRSLTNDANEKVAEIANRLVERADARNK